FLGGDDFDRLLASHVLERGKWTAGGAPVADPSALAALFDPAAPAGGGDLAPLGHPAGGGKGAPTRAGTGGRAPAGSAANESGELLSVELTVSRGDFDRLIKAKVDRTIDCCREALARAKERAGVTLAGVDYVVLVGGSSRVPLVRDTVKAAFCNADLP